MSFLQPKALLLLTLIPVLILFHLLKLKRGEKVVPSLAFWEGGGEDRSADSISIKPPRSISLPLQIALLTALTLALSRPVLTSIGPLEGNLLIVLDASASMRTEEDGGIRFEKAKRAALGLIESLGSGRVTLVRAGIKPEVILRGEGDKATLRKAIEAMEPGEGRADLLKAVLLGYSDDISLIAIITDRSFDLSKLPKKIADRIAVFPVGESLPNWGITSLKAIPDPISNAYSLAVAISAYNAPRKRITLWAYVGGEPVDAKSVEIGGRETVRATLRLDGRLAGRTVRLELEVDDPFPLDDRVELPLRPLRKVKVLVVAGSEATRPFIERAFTSSPLAEAKVIGPDRFASRDGFDLIVFDNWVPERVPDGLLVFVNPARGLPSMPVVGVKESPVILRVRDSHPLMRYVDLTGVGVKEMLSYEMPDWGEPLVETDDQPLIWLGESPRRKGLILCFDAFNPRLTDFPLHPSCPIFAHNLMLWARGNLWAAPPVVRVGEEVILNGAAYPGFEEMKVMTPKGEEVIMSGERFAFRPDSIGIYRVLVDGEEVERFAAALLNPGESDLTLSLIHI